MCLGSSSVALRYAGCTDSRQYPHQGRLDRYTQAIFGTALPRICAACIARRDGVVSWGTQTHRPLWGGRSMEWWPEKRRIDCSRSVAKMANFPLDARPLALLRLASGASLTPRSGLQVRICLKLMLSLSAGGFMSTRSMRPCARAPPGIAVPAARARPCAGWRHGRRGRSRSLARRLVVRRPPAPEAGAVVHR